MYLVDYDEMYLDESNAHYTFSPENLYTKSFENVTEPILVPKPQSLVEAMYLIDYDEMYFNKNNDVSKIQMLPESYSLAAVTKARAGSLVVFWAKFNDGLEHDVAVKQDPNTTKIMMAQTDPNDPHAKFENFQPISEKNYQNLDRYIGCPLD